MGLDLNLALEMERWSRGGVSFSIAMVQIDNLGRIQENEGIAGGNATLREVAVAIGAQLRGTDVIGRFTGDMFLLILSQTAQNEALIVAERISTEVGKLKLLTNAQPLTLSIGITESAPNETVALMLERAEEALLTARRDGENCARVVLGADADMDAADSALSATA